MPKKLELKRNNWSNQEIIHLLKGLKITEDCFGKGVSEKEKQATLEHHNPAINDAIEIFEDFERDTQEAGAMAYNPKTKEVVHIGPLLPR